MPGKQVEDRYGSGEALEGVLVGSGGREDLSPCSSPKRGLHVDGFSPGSRIQNPEPSMMKPFSPALPNVKGPSCNEFFVSRVLGRRKRVEHLVVFMGVWLFHRLPNYFPFFAAAQAFPM